MSAGKRAIEIVQQIRTEISKVIVGQEEIIEQVLITLLADEINRTPAKSQSALL